MKIIIIQMVIMVLNLSRATGNRALCSAAKARYSLEFLDIEFIGVALSWSDCVDVQNDLHFYYSHITYIENLTRVVMKFMKWAFGEFH